MYVNGGKVLQGYSVGILKFAGKKFAMPPGDVGNPTSYPFPVLIREIPDVSTNPSPPVIMPDGTFSELVRNCIAAAQEMEADGVRSIAMWCGFFSLIQPILAKHVSVPILSSPLIMLPVIHQMMPPEKSIAVVVASEKLLTAEYFDAINAKRDERIVIVGMDDAPVFNSFCMGGPETGYEFDDFGAELCELMDTQIAKHPEIGAIMLECTSLPPFAARIGAHTGLPVYDFIACVEWMHRAVVPKTYDGYI
ncbi:hypothetical protein [Ruegeria hyattellae]|uniref:hypothetical protein n=1 Tax=Ruegeria hyattellae TaxID=3233337 RepID=UPI00355C333B